MTTQPRIGPGRDDAKEGLILNRVVRWTTEGLEYEADPRQAEKLIQECGLRDANTMATLGLRASFEETENDQPLEPRLHTAFRGAAARANYLAADRIDCQCRQVKLQMDGFPDGRVVERSQTTLQVLGRAPKVGVFVQLASRRRH